jgi:iron complex transport system ATP-binding protein
LTLAVEALSFGYRGRIVGGPVSFAVAPGEVLCLLGPNGGGKTTLFKTVLGLLPPIAGSVAMDGADTARWDPRQRARAIGYVPQSGVGQFPFTVHEMVLMGRTAHRGTFAAPGAADHEAAESALATLGIAALGARDWLRLSGGERQLALVARALAQQPRLLVLDEPTANLDFGNQVRVLDQVRQLAAGGLAVLFSTHHPEQAFACATRVALLQNGGLTPIGTPDETITSATMKLVYGTDVDIVPVGPTMKACVPHAWRGSP